MSSECCDVIVAHSPPIFTAHNAKPELSVLYQNWLVISQKQQSPLAVRRYNARSSNSPTREDKQAVQIKTRRPCLVIRTDSDGSIGSSSSSSSDENEPSSPTRRKKKVVFADDRGLSLTQVRLMNEPSNQPPKLMMTVGPYLQQKNNGGVAATAPSSQPAAQPPAAGPSVPRWRLWFPQPASNYLDFRRRLDVDNVSLENVIVKPADRWIVGTVKVRNLSYDKEVFVRSTRDRWATHLDTVCAYVQNNAMVTAAAAPSSAASAGGQCGGCGPGPAANVAAIYDTFSFRLPLPRDAAAMEFAVCYKSPEFECWDNNDGRNYRLSVQEQQQQQSGGPAVVGAARRPLSPSSSSSQLLLLPTSASSSSPYDFGAGAADHSGNKQPVHYFGALSKHSSWALRDQKNDTSAYW